MLKTKKSQRGYLCDFFMIWKFKISEPDLGDFCVKKYSFVTVWLFNILRFVIEYQFLLRAFKI